jgi:murein DD-endopeptidase MepM/ murein hydrolase activator NlpD
MAAQSGVVAFAGPIAGALFVSIDHADGVRTTYSWLSDVAVAEGQAVGRFQLIGKSGAGHPGSAIPHLHFGARIGRTYLDPMLLLGPGSVVGVIHLAPLADGAGGDGAWLADGMVLAGQGGKPP